MRLERFGGVEFGRADVTDELGSMADTDFIATPIGGYDARVDDESLDVPASITKRYTIYKTTPEEVQTELDALRALRGVRAKLWARTYDDEVRFVWARLQRVDYRRTNRNFNVQPVSLTWRVGNQHWRGHDHTAWVLDEGYYLDDGLYLDDDGYTFTLDTAPKFVTVTNGGNRATPDVRFTITAVTTPITVITLSCGDAEFTYTGSVAVGEQLVIDCGAQQVLNDGADAYIGFSLGASHGIEEWMLLEPGDNIIEVARTGGNNSTLLVEFQDRWA